MMKAHLQSLYLDTLILDSLPTDAVLVIGDFAMMKITSLFLDHYHLGMSCIWTFFQS